MTKFYELFCALTFKFQYSRIEDQETKKNKELDNYRKKLDEILSNRKCKKINDFKKLDKFFNETRKRLEGIISILGVQLMQHLTESMKNSVLAKQNKFHSKICLEEENFEFHNELKNCKDTEREQELEEKIKASKAIKDHTPYCYQYHSYFFKSGEECKNVKFWEGSTVKEKKENKLCRNTFVEINLNEQNEKTVEHFLDTKLPEIWGLYLKHVEMFRGIYSFEDNMERFLADVFPEKLKQLSMSADKFNPQDNLTANSFNISRAPKKYKIFPRFGSKNIKQICDLLDSKRIAQVLTLAGFEMTDAQFNEIISHSVGLHSLEVRNCGLISVNFARDPSTPLNINVKPLLASKTLKKLIMTQNTWGDEIAAKVNSTVINSRLNKQLSLIHI